MTAQHILIDGQVIHLSNLRSELTEQLQSTRENTPALVRLYLDATGDPEAYAADEIADCAGQLALAHLYPHATRYGFDEPEPEAFADALNKRFYATLDALRRTLDSNELIPWWEY